MPLYTAKCAECGHITDYYSPVDKRDETPVHCGKPMERRFSPPHVIEDMKPYISPLDGKPVKSRKAHRDHMVRHGVIEVGNEKLTRPATQRKDLPGLEQDIYNAMVADNDRTG